MTASEPVEITRLLEAWRAGEPAAEEQLFDALHGELRALAAKAMRSERPDHTLQPTELVHEAYLRLGPDASDWKDRAHFLSVAGRVMRRILIDHARAKATAKRGGGAVRVTLDPHAVPGASPDLDLAILDRAMDALNRLDQRKARFLEMRYFAGLSNREIATVSEVSERTVKRELQLARAWLRREIDSGDASA